MRIVDDLVAKGPGCDFVTEVAARLPLKIICDMMGIPEKDYRTVFDRSNVILGGFDPEYVGLDMNTVAERLLTAGMELQQLVQDLAAHRAEHPTTDLTSSLVNANIDGEKLTMQELGSFFILLVVAGNETTRNAISHGLRLFTEHPDQRELLLQDLDGRLPGAVEEIVRLASPVNYMRRKVTRDHEMNGHLYRAGEKVVFLLLGRQPRRERLRRPAPLRHHPQPQPPHRLRRPGAALLPGRPPRPPRDHRDVPRAAPSRPADRGRRPRAAPLQLHQRDQADGVRLLGSPAVSGNPYGTVTAGMITVPPRGST
ncbi:hypothetical protein GCM10018952_73670 [Streptosporangium vulgare]